MLSASNFDPAYVFHGTIYTFHKLCMFHVWGCPVCVIHQKISNGPNLPRWKPNSRHNIFLGYITNHSSDVPLVLNLTPGYISPQYHVVLDDTFGNVQSISNDEDPPLLCNDVSLDLFTHQVPLEPGHSAVLHDEWLSPSEREEKYMFIQREYHIHASYQPSQPSFFIEYHLHNDPH